MKKIRPPKNDDQENTEKAYSYIQKLYADHPEIEPTIWAGALFGALATGYLNCGWTHKEFCEELDLIKDHYKNWWEQNATLNL